MVPPVKPLFSRVFNRVKDFAYERFRHQVRFPSQPAKILPTTYEVVEPQNVSEVNIVPSHIQVPAYVFDEEEVPALPILKKSAQEIQRMKASCRLARKILEAAKNQIKVGLTTDELDKYIHELIIQHQAYPSPLRYKGFPKSICTSVNNIVCHGIPDDRPLANGDIITVDVTVYHQGYHGDCAATYLVGDVDDEGKSLVRTAEAILMKAISACKPGRKMDVIGRTITSLAAEAKLSVIPSVFGHGIGQYFHEAPSVNHYNHVDEITFGNFRGTPKIEYDAEEGDETMVPGMTFTIEPAFGTGSQETELYDDGWTLTTVDDSRAAQFEHTVLITDTGVEVLTK